MEVTVVTTIFLEACVRLCIVDLAGSRLQIQYLLTRRWKMEELTQAEIEMIGGGITVGFAVGYNWSGLGKSIVLGASVGALGGIGVAGVGALGGGIGGALVGGIAHAGGSLWDEHC